MYLVYVREGRAEHHVGDVVHFDVELDAWDVYACPLNEWSRHHVNREKAPPEVLKILDEYDKADQAKVQAQEAASDKPDKAAKPEASEEE